MESVEAEKRNGRPVHYAWVILFACCALSGGTLGTVINCRGLYIAPVCADMGYSVSQFTLHTTFYGLAAAATMMLFVDRLFDYYPMRWILSAALVAFHGATAAMGLFEHLIGWYIAGAIQGISGAFLLFVPVPMIINHWFVERKGLALGLSSMTAGLIGAVMNPLLQAVIANWGWRTAYGVQSLIGFVMCFPCALFLIYKTPEERGIEPYGAEYKDLPRKRVTRSLYDESRKNKFWCCALFTSISSFSAAYAQHLANFASSIELQGSAGAAMVSASMLGNIAAKTLLGPGCDKWGNQKMCMLSLGMPLSGFMILAFGGGGVAGLLAGAFLLGVCHANLTIMAPLLTAASVPSEEYDHAISKTTTCNMLTSAFSTMLIGFIYELTGSYVVVFLIGGLLQILSLTVVMYLYTNKKQ